MKAEIKFANTNNGPKAFVKTFDDDWTPMSTPLKAYKKDMRSIKPAGNYEEGKDYMVAVSPWVLEAFLKANQIDYVQLIRGQDLKNPSVGSIRYANEKEVVWYEYSSATTTRRCTDLSRAKSFVQEWVNLDCPTLKRFSTNQKVLSVNGFGAAVPLFESPLVDTSYVDTVIADDIEDKEIEGLRKHLNPDGVISQLLNNVQKARAEKGIDEVESRVKQVETQIRLFLRTPEIENEIKDIETAHLNEEGGFDCGFIFWYPKADSQLEKDMSLLVGANRRKLSWLDIAVPTFSQSINVQRYGAELIKGMNMKAIKRFAMLLAVLSPFLLNVSFGFADTATRTCSVCGQKFTVTTPAADDAKTFEAYNKVNSIKGVESDKSATYTAITDANVYATTINGKPLCSNCLSTMGAATSTGKGLPKTASTQLLASATAVYTITVPETVKLTGVDSGPGSYTADITMTLKGDVEENAVIVVSVDGGTMTNTAGKTAAVTVSNQTKSKWSRADLLNDGTSATCKVSAELDPGHWTGTATFSCEKQYK